jgi:hypothetical protein
MDISNCSDKLVRRTAYILQLVSGSLPHTPAPVARTFRPTAVHVVLGLSLLAIIAPAFAADPTVAPRPSPTAQPSPAESAEAASRQAWRKSMSRSGVPKNGCFQATYPNTDWQQVPCTTAPQRPYPPAHGKRPETGGNGGDYSAETTSPISFAEGSFASITGVINETGAGVANQFSLQLNTSLFTTTSCNGGASGCVGWQQFVFTNCASHAARARINAG